MPGSVCPATDPPEGRSPVLDGSSAQPGRGGKRLDICNTFLNYQWGRECRLRHLKLLALSVRFHEQKEKEPDFPDSRNI